MHNDSWLITVIQAHIILPEERHSDELLQVNYMNTIKLEYF